MKDARKAHHHLVSLSCVVASALFMCSGGAEAQVSMVTGWDVGNRTDNFNWNIANTDGLPDILSELTWRDLSIQQLRVKLELRERAAWVSGNVGYGKITAGTNQDSDYDENGRTSEFSRSNNDARGDVVDSDFRLGYEFELAAHNESRFGLSPFLGISQHYQNFDIVDGHQTISIPSSRGFGTPGPIGPIDDLHSSYDARWRAIAAGLMAKATLNKNFDLVVAAEGYFRGTYRAEADWNLSSSFQHPVSFRHIANASGYALSLGGSYRWGGGCAVDMSVFTTSWDADPGTDTTFYVRAAPQSTTLNDVNWTSRGVRLGFTCS